jgi:hypothetical protein
MPYQAKEDVLWFVKDQIVDKIEPGWECYFTEIPASTEPELKKKPSTKRK